MTAFDDIRDGFALLTNETALLKTENFEKQFLCSQACSGNSECLSYNYCTQLCYLNSDDVFVEGTELLINSTCVYGGMKRSTGPACKERGRIIDHVNVKNSTTTSVFCGIEAKMSHPHWDISTEMVRIKNDSDWMNTEQRVCNLGSHVDPFYCKGNTIIIHDWLKWFKDAQTFDDAVQTCENVDGQLFGDVNGSQSVLSFIHKRLGYSTFYIGATDWQEPGTFVNFRGVDISPFMSIGDNWNGLMQYATAKLEGLCWYHCTLIVTYN